MCRHNENKYGIINAWPAVCQPSLRTKAESTQHSRQQTALDLLKVPSLSLAVSLSLANKRKKVKAMTHTHRRLRRGEGWEGNEGWVARRVVVGLSEVGRRGWKAMPTTGYINSGSSEVSFLAN